MYTNNLNYGLSLNAEILNSELKNGFVKKVFAKMRESFIAIYAFCVFKIHTFIFKIIIIMNHVFRIYGFAFIAVLHFILFSLRK